MKIFKNCIKKLLQNKENPLFNFSFRLSKIVKVHTPFQLLEA